VVHHISTKWSSTIAARARTLRGKGYEVTEPPTDRSAGAILEYSDGIAAARTLIAYMRRVYVP